MTLILLFGSAQAQSLAAEEALPEAIDIQVSEAGLGALADALPALLPVEPLELEDLEDETGLGCLGYRYALQNMFVEIEIGSASLRAEPGQLMLDIDVRMSVNEPSDPFQMELEAICLIDEACDGHILPFDMSVSAPLSLSVVGDPGSRSLQASVGTLAIDHDLSSQELQVGCGINEIEFVLNIFGTSIFDLVIGLFESTLVDLIDGPLNDALVALSLQEIVELGDAALEIRLQPEGVEISDAGLELVLATQFLGEPHPCVEAFDPGSIPLSGGPRPQNTENPPGTHLAAHVAQDMVDQALYAAWRSGLLCQEISEDAGIDLAGLSLDTSLLGLVAGESYRELFPEAAPLLIRTSPQQPPRAVVGGDHALGMELEGLGLDFFAELDGRMARVLGVGIEGPLGVDVPFDAKTGELSVAIDLGEESLSASLTGDPFVPDAEQIADGLGDTLSGLLDTVLSGLLGDTLAFPLPSFEGIGVTSLETDTSGAQQDWLAVRGSVGATSYPASDACGCGEKDPYGKGGGECDTGCSVAGPGVAGWLALIVGVALRRRRDR